MKLRGRFTLTLALAALVPITVAAVVTRQVIANSNRRSYRETRANVENALRTNIGTAQKGVEQAVAALATHNHPFIGTLLIGLYNVETGQPGEQYKLQNYIEEQSGPTMRGLALDVLAIADKNNRYLAAPHLEGSRGEGNHPEVRDRAERSHGKAYFVREHVRAGSFNGDVLVAEAARIAQDDKETVSLLAGRKVDTELFTGVIWPDSTDARIVAVNTEEVLIPPTHEWGAISKDEPIRVPLYGLDGKTPVANVEIAVSDGDMARVLRNVTLTSAALALAALVGVVLVGLLVARRTARDLDQLVTGSLAASRGDLDHRVPVRADDEIGAVASAFNFMMEDLKTSKERLVIAERIAAWQEIARRLAHEIKNPLTPIQMAMDTLRKTWKKKHPSFDEILEESTATVMEEADRLKHIVSEFSAFARMPKPEFGRVDLNDIIRSALALYQGGPIAFDIKLSTAIPPIDADKNQLNQTVLNLVENARDAIGARENGRITVATRLGEAGDRAMLVVEDNGPGVPGELKDKVFAPYFTTKHAKGGTGLGLAIVHRIVSDHGGRIAVSDVPGGGARFIIELPLRNGTALLASRI